MTRSIRLAFVGPALTAAAVSFAACSAPESPKAAAGPTPAASPAAALAVYVTAAEGASPEAMAWVREVETAVAAREGELELATGKDAAGLVVRVASVEKVPPGGAETAGDAEAVVMRGALVVGDATREFNLTYRGEARPQAEALARNLRRFADEMKRGAAAAPASPE